VATKREQELVNKAVARNRRRKKKAKEPDSVTEAVVEEVAGIGEAVKATAGAAARTVKKLLE
jgi:hypothetical protein